jgi:excisionase family DNA binding protein
MRRSILSTLELAMNVFRNLSGNIVKCYNVGVKKGLPAGESVAVYELARFLKVRREQVLEWIDEGELSPAYDLRGKGSSRSLIRIPRAAVVEFLESRPIVCGKGKLPRSSKSLRSF